MTVKEALARLEALGVEKVRAMHRKNGAGENLFGARMGDIRKVAAKAKTDHALALALWQTGNLDARLMATLVCIPEEFSPDELDAMVRAADFAWLAEWLTSYVVKKHPGKEALRRAWMRDAHPWAARAGWNLTAERVGKDAEGLDLAALLDRIEAEMAGAEPAAQWAMNTCLATIGIHFPEHRKRAVAIGEALGVYRDYPVSKGCTSPFAPLWIEEMVRRQEA